MAGKSRGADLKTSNDCLKEAVGHLKSLLCGMEKWSRDEDGIHGGAFDAYRAAREYIGQPIPDSGERDDVTWLPTR